MDSYSIAAAVIEATQRRRGFSAVQFQATVLHHGKSELQALETDGHTVSIVKSRANEHVLTCLCPV